MISQTIAQRHVSLLYHKHNVHIAFSTSQRHLQGVLCTQELSQHKGSFQAVCGGGGGGWVRGEGRRRGHIKLSTRPLASECTVPETDVHSCNSKWTEQTAYLLLHMLFFQADVWSHNSKWTGHIAYLLSHRLAIINGILTNSGLHSLHPCQRAILDLHNEQTAQFIQTAQFTQTSRFIQTA